MFCVLVKFTRFSILCSQGGNILTMADLKEMGIMEGDQRLDYFYGSTKKILSEVTVIYFLSDYLMHNMTRIT